MAIPLGMSAEEYKSRYGSDNMVTLPAIEGQPTVRINTDMPLTTRIISEEVTTGTYIYPYNQIITQPITETPINPISYSDSGSSSSSSGSSSSGSSSSGTFYPEYSEYNSTSQNTAIISIVFTIIILFLILKG